MQINLLLNFNKILLLCIVAQLAACTSTSKLTLPSSKNLEKGSAQDLVATARDFLGVPYKYGGQGPTNFDCSGLVCMVYTKNNRSCPRITSLQSKLGSKIHWSSAKAADLLFFSTEENDKIDHVAMVVKNDGDQLWIIHSTTSRGVIEEDLLASTYWNKRLKMARRVL